MALVRKVSRAVGSALISSSRTRWVARGDVLRREVPVGVERVTRIRLPAAARAARERSTGAESGSGGLDGRQQPGVEVAAGAEDHVGVGDRGDGAWAWARSRAGRRPAGSSVVTLTASPPTCLTMSATCGVVATTLSGSPSSALVLDRSAAAAGKRERGDRDKRERSGRPQRPASAAQRDHSGSRKESDSGHGSDRRAGRQVKVQRQVQAEQLPR